MQLDQVEEKLGGEAGAKEGGREEGGQARGCCRPAPPAHRFPPRGQRRGNMRLDSLLLLSAPTAETDFDLKREQEGRMPKERREDNRV